MDPNNKKRNIIDRLSDDWSDILYNAKGKRKFYIIGLIVSIAMFILFTVFSILLDSVPLLVFAMITLMVVIFIIYPIYSSIQIDKNSFEQLPKAVKGPIALLGAGLFLGFYYYIVLPPLSLRNSSFITFLMLCLVCLSLVIVYVFKLFYFSKKENGERTYHKVNFRCLIAIISATLLYAIGGTLSGIDLFRAKDLASLLEIEHVSETVEIDSAFDYQEGDIILPTHDLEMSYRQAEITLSDYGNQYYINQNHFSIQSLEHNGEQRMVRVAPLEYSNFFLSLQNNHIGTPGYILVDLVTGNAELIDDYPLVYVEEAKLQTDIARTIRLNNLYALYDNYYFEVDDDYIPYWVVPCYEKKVGLFNGKVPSYVITINANTGSSAVYDIPSAPHWIDNVIDRRVAEELANYALRYQKGYINATIGTKDGVYIMNDGYNYFIKDGEPFFVSSVTSNDERDQTSVGFLTISLRTMKTKFYHTTGITENRSMDIAKLDDSVKAMNLTATWPIFISIEDTPTYFLTLKNDVQVQKYVFINQKTGSDPVIADSLTEAYNLYLSSLGATPVDNSIEGTISRTNIVGEYLYFSLTDDEATVYRLPLSLDPRSYILKEGDEVSFNYIEQDGFRNITSIISLTFKKN